LRLIQPTGVNRLESHRVDLGQILQRFSRSGNRRNALANRRRIVGALPVRLPIRSTRPSASTVSSGISRTWYLNDVLPIFGIRHFIYWLLLNEVE